MTQHAKKRHQLLLPIKTSNNHDTGGNSTFLEGFFKFVKHFGFTNHNEHRKFKKWSKIMLDLTRNCQTIHSIIMILVHRMSKNGPNCYIACHQFI